MKKSRPVLIVFSILAGMQVLTNGTGLSEIVDPTYAFLLGLLVAAVQTGMTFYVQGLTVPLDDVAAYVTGGDSPSTIAGPASAVADGTEVTVLETPPA